MRASLSATVITATALVSACATQGELAPTEQEEALAAQLESVSIVPATAEERAAIATQDPLTRAAFWAEAYDMNPGDREAAVEFARVLREIGNVEQSVDISRRALALYPEDPGLLKINGLALTATGRGDQAIEALNRAHRVNPNDWELLNALGVAYEQAGDGLRARERFTQALLVAPNEPSVLSNLGLSYALSGDPTQAEEFLRRAVRLEGASPQVRQNLALVLALQGRFDEAEQIARQDVTPEMAQQNMDYVRAMITSPRSWDRLMADEPLNN